MQDSLRGIRLRADVRLDCGGDGAAARTAVGRRLRPETETSFNRAALTAPSAIAYTWVTVSDKDGMDMNGQWFHRALWGLLIIGLGVVFLLNRIGLLALDIGSLIATFWPVFLIIIGLQGLAGGYRHGGGLWGGLPAVIGVIFLARNLGLVEWSIGDIFATLWPVALIIFGLTLIFRPRGDRRGRPDDWRAYTNPPPPEPPASREFPDASVPVPPAPPLHPDPFAPPEAGRPTPPQGGQAPPAYDAAEEDPRERYRRERRAYRDFHRGRHGAHGCSGKDRVEWWNSDPGVLNRSGFIGDIHLGHDYWELKPMNISHFIGDTVLDLTKAQIPPGETKITVSSFIGDVKVFIPNDYELGVHVISSAFLGDAAVLDRKEGGMFRNMDVQSPYYQETDKKIRLVVSTFIGDLRVTKVG